MTKKKPATKAPAAKAVGEMEVFYSIGDSREEKEHTLGQFVDDVYEHRPIPQHVLEFVAEGIDAYLASGDPGWLKKSRGREPDNRRDFKSWACWYALRCDNELMAMPKDEEGAPGKAAALLHVGVGGKRMRDLAGRFEGEPLASDGFLLAIHWRRYAEHRGWPLTEETYTRMADMYASWRDSSMGASEE